MAIHRAALGSAPFPSGNAGEIDRLVAPARRRLIAQVMLNGALYGAAAGLVVAAALTGLSHLAGLDHAQAWATAAIATGLLAGIGRGLSRRPSRETVIRLVDHRLALHDRLVTARELADAAAPLALLQRRDTYRRMSEMDTRRAAPWRLPRYGMAALGVALLALLLTAWSPNPAAARARQQTAERHKVAAAAGAVAKARLVTPARHTTLSGEELARRREIERIMASLRRQLAGGAVPAAIQAIAQAQDHLAHLSTQRASAQARALAALIKSLPRQGAIGALSRALQAGDQQKTRDALRALAKAVHSMPSAQRAALASALEKAANSASKAAGGASAQAEALRALASALVSGDKGGAQSALAAVAAALGAAQDATAAERASSQASSALENIKRSLAGLPPLPSSSDDPAAAPGSGDSSTPGGTNEGGANGGKPSSGSGAKGTGPGAGSGHGAGQGTGSGRGGGHGAGGGRGGAGAVGEGKLERVYVPSRTGHGPSQTTNGPNGLPASGASHPYGEVLASYSTSARSSLERGALPTSLRNAVKRYFATLSH